MRLACITAITLACGCGQLANPESDSGPDVLLTVDASDASDADACAIVDAENCVSKVHLLACGCDADVCTGYASCVSDDDVCAGFPGADHCSNVCDTNEYGANCGGGPVKSALPPSPSCREMVRVPLNQRT